ncbi:MAG: hypothetical protein J0I12_23865 [Candidatus Eremiobacteraeota bacterium]|nr:hypothetical protein [Candidatus Eremiobacteraeota bacterium]
MSELDEILAEHSALVSAGEGRFTVDPRRQRELLAKLGLQNTTQGFLKLCQGIHRLRPTRVLFRAEKNLLQVSFAHELPLPEPVWEPSEPLGLALLNLSREFFVGWSFHNAGALRSGHVAPESFRAAPLDFSPHQGAWTLVRITRPDFRWWHRDWTTGVKTLLVPRLAWNPPIWEWNEGALVPEPLSSRAEALILAGPGVPGELEIPPANEGVVRRIRDSNEVGEETSTGRSPRLGSAHAILGATKNSWSETFFVLDGVLLEGERNLLDRPGIKAIVSADGLTPSLSGLELVHDAAFRQRLQGLRPEVSWLDGINQRS